MKVLGQSMPIYEAVKKREAFSEWTCEFICKENRINKNSWLWRQGRCSPRDEGEKQYHRAQGIRVSVGKCVQMI